MAHGSCSLGDYQTVSPRILGLLPVHDGHTAKSIGLVFPKGFWPQQPPGMGRDHFPAAPIGTGCVWVAAGGGLVALLGEGADGHGVPGLPSS